jgi:hypothetical protein
MTKARVSVPEEALVRRASPPDNPVHAEIARLERELAGARGELVGVREALGEARARADAAAAEAEIGGTIRRPGCRAGKD